MTRQLWKLSELPDGRYPLRATLARLGNAVWIFVSGELYQVLQTTLRAQFPENPLIVATLSDGWQPGYIPTADSYGHGIYQEEIAVVARGSLEQIVRWGPRLRDFWTSRRRTFHDATIKTVFLRLALGRALLGSRPRFRR
jgi:hypothetical protein